MIFNAENKENLERVAERNLSHGFSFKSSFHQPAQEINCVAGYLVDSREYLNSPYKYRDNDRGEKGEKGMKGGRRAIVVGGGAD